MPALNAGALTTLAAAKEELGITDSTQDDRLRRLINAATSTINRYCGRVFSKATITDERQLLVGGPRAVVGRAPIVSITSITIEGATTAIDSSSYIRENDEAGVLYFKSGLPASGFHRGGISQDRQPGTEAPILLFTYVGGYVTPAQADTGGAYAAATITLPDEIETACLDLVGYYNAHRGTGGTIASESLGDASVTYKDEDTGAGGAEVSIPAHIRARLNPYRRTFFV